MDGMERRHFFVPIYCAVLTFKIMLTFHIVKNKQKRVSRRGGKNPKMQFKQKQVNPAKNQTNNKTILMWERKT